MCNLALSDKLGVKDVQSRKTAFIINGLGSMLIHTLSKLFGSLFIHLYLNTAVITNN